MRRMKGTSESLRQIKFNAKLLMSLPILPSKPRRYFQPGEKAKSTVVLTWLIFQPFVPGVCLRSYFVMVPLKFRPWDISLCTFIINVVEWLQDISPPSDVYRVSATDADGSGNNVITYSIESGNVVSIDTGAFHFRKQKLRELGKWSIEAITN